MEDVTTQSALAAAVDELRECKSVEDVMRVSAYMAEIFRDNDVVLEFLCEIAVEQVESFEERRPEMTLEQYRAIMRSRALAEA